MRAFRKIGKDCIQGRIKAIEDGGEVPQDVLTHILKSASKYVAKCFILLLSGNVVMLDLSLFCVPDFS